MRSLALRVVLVAVCAIVCGGFLFAQQRYSVVISEIMADPTPQVGLPNTEWIELHNSSSTAINIGGWRIGKPGSQSGPIAANTMLQPDSNIVICTASQVAALSAFGRTVSVTSFPSLGNDGDVILLIGNSGSVVHAVSYNISWYGNALKADGGYTLEMIDTRNACAAASNWKASNSTTGGTPAQTNSITANNPDGVAPTLVSAFASGSNAITLYFNEGLDSSNAATLSLYNIQGVTLLSASVASPLFNTVTLTTQTTLSAGTIYTINANGVKDCSGNTMGASSTTIALPQAADSLDVVINEILFNPRPLSSDYVELYNRSNKPINLRQLYLANRSSTTGLVGSLTQLSTQDRLILPGTYVVITTNATTLQQEYTVGDVDNIVTLSSMPSYPDDRGWVVLMDQQGSIIDEVPYLDDWHFKLLDNEDGVALERIDADGPSNKADNWTSAAKSAGFGTPAAANSQNLAAQNSNAATLSLTPTVFSPDNDGFEDFVIVTLKPETTGYVANITILDAAGRPVRVLQRNATLGNTSNFRWDGLNDKQQRVQPGYYVVVAELYNLQGTRLRLKETVGVAIRR